MRAQEFIVEYKISARKNPKGVKVVATDDKGKQIGHVEFANYFSGSDEKTLEAKYLAVDPKYQRQGIARAMYDLVKSRGYVIIRSGDQTFDGGKFWDKHRGEKGMVWEKELSEISRDRLERYLSRAGHQVDSRLERMVRARQRLNTSYEIYHADKPTKIVDRFEADTPVDAQRYYQDYIERYQSDVDYDLRLRRATGIDEQLDEGLRDWVAALALTGAMALGTPADAKQAPVAPTQSVEQVSQVLSKPAAQVLKKAAIKAGIVGTELAQFMAQCAHETANFSTLKEIGGSRDFKKYDPKYAPKKARALGNIKPGDGAKYAGRGFIQLTGRDNYKRAGQALGLPLEQQPELVERPDVAAKVAVWFWQNRVAPKVASFHDTKQATKPINPGMRGLADRQAKFNAIKQGAMARPGDLAPRGRKI